MKTTQFRVLYREFLFRIIDLELLAPHGNMSKLLGQFAALLLVVGLWILLPATGVGAVPRPELRLVLTWTAEHFLIATTMLAVGVFAVLSWESMFPDQRDVQVLRPLPIAGSTLFLAKIAAVATALGVTVVALNLFPSLGAAFSFSDAAPGWSRFGAVLRTCAAYWGAMFGSAIFVFCAVVTLQGVAQLLPRQIFLRVSSSLQLGLFVLILIVYFLQPPFAGVTDLAAHSDLIPWLPSYCFFGFFQQLNGPLLPLFAPFAQRAWIGLAASIVGAASSYLICHYRTLPKIAEQPDIQPAVRRLRRLPSFGNSLQTAVVQFCVRTLFRSRQHRLILSFYLGTALGIAILVSKAPALRRPDLWGEAGAPLAVASIVMVCGAALGARIVFSIPLDLKANWIFRIVRTPSVRQCLSATRRALWGLAVVPVWLVVTAFVLRSWPVGAATAHAFVLAALAVILAEVLLYGFHKIPFTCSYLPGRSYFHMRFIAAFVLLMFIINRGASLEVDALGNVKSSLILIGVLAVVAYAAWARTTAGAGSSEMIRFEERDEPVIETLGLGRDGALVADDLKRT